VRGQVKNFDEQKGFGFIEVPNEPDVFVHFSGIEGSGRKELRPGEQVDLVVVQGVRGPQAAHVQVITDDEEGSL
jgi:CspA family cold shock protein